MYWGGSIESNGHSTRGKGRGLRLNATPFLRQWPSFSVTVLTVLRIRWLLFVLWPAPLFLVGILGLILARFL